MTPDGLQLNAGWYADPESSSGERWWNGSQWTSHTRESGAETQHPEWAGQPPTAWSAEDADLATVTPPAQKDPVIQRPTAYFEEYPPVVLPAPPVPLAIAPGWYPDPAGLPAQRWWDGLAWTDHQAPAAGYGPYPAPGYHHPYGPYAGTTVVLAAPPKSVGVAFVLTFFFGPLGMLYSTVTGAMVMLGVSLLGSFMVAVLTFGLGLIVWWPIIWVTSIIWGCLAAANQPNVPVINAYYR